MRIALGIEYDGHGYYGWQVQENLPTIQTHLEKALSSIANEPVRIFCAGRTDTGVHALGQVVHFDTTAQRPTHAWTIGTNTHLPDNIGVMWAQEVDDNFHARFGALSRSYRYIIYNHHLPSAIMNNRVTWHMTPLDAERMQQAANFLLGEHNFNSFRSSHCQAKSPVRVVHGIKVSRTNRFVVIEIEANAFLHHMVRNIAGVLLRIGSGQAQPGLMQEVLAARDRRSAFETASPTGLYLQQVRYPVNYDFPAPENLPLFLSR
jgi:tRNA pseudouridine38-40 synthase